MHCIRAYNLAQCMLCHTVGAVNTAHACRGVGRSCVTRRINPSVVFRHCPTDHVCQTECHNSVHPCVRKDAAKIPTTP